MSHRARHSLSHRLQWQPDPPQSSPSWSSSNFHRRRLSTILSCDSPITTVSCQQSRPIALLGNVVEEVSFSLAGGKIRDGGEEELEFSSFCILNSASRSENELSLKFGEIVVYAFSGSLEHRNHSINFYSKCTVFSDARKLIEESHEPDLVSWSSLISGYAQNELGEEALLAFQEMHVLGVKCNEFTFPSVLKACSSTKNFMLGTQVHGIIVVTGFESDVFVANTLVVMYAKCGHFLDSRRLFEDIPERDVEMISSGISPDEFSLSTILNAATDLGDIGQGKKVHGYLIKLGYERDPFSLNALVDMYAKVGDLGDSLTVFDDIPESDIASWNAAIAGCVSHDYHQMALKLFDHMKRSGIYPNMFTLSSALKACAALGVQELGKQFHAKLIKMEIMKDPFVSVGLIDMYCKCRLVKDAITVYDLMPEKDLVALNVMISGHTQNGEDRESITLFIHALIVKSGYHGDNFISNSLVDSYGKCRQLHEAARVFEECPIDDLPSYTSIMTAYAQYGRGDEALKLYLKLLDMDLKPDSFICRFMSDVFAGNSLVNMYAKCGSIEDTTRAFSEVYDKTVISWSAMIGGLAQHGHGKEALHLFDEMLKDGISPNHVTLVSVLSACNHGGLVNEAEWYFETMKEQFGIEPTQEHYACMIDVLGRAGKLDKAMHLVNNMPFEANSMVWGALLGAAKIHKDVEIGQRAAEILYTLEPEKSGAKIDEDSKVKKEPGMSWMESETEAILEEIYAKLEKLGEQMVKAGYVPKLEVDLHDVEKQEKELLLSYHSEKLAVAFRLIATPPGAPIRVKKNLHICLDCHSAFKYICKIESREIIIRDINRFPHFRDGSCSCGDYWSLSQMEGTLDCVSLPVTLRGVSPFCIHEHELFFRTCMLVVHLVEEYPVCVRLS
ncbi:UNVERIFIED_CONTAM: Pentatricopeptide repeat-containing protein [Sesamum indicum]